MLALIVGALAGYLVGASMKENELTAQHDAEISKLESDLEATKSNVGSSVDDAKSAIKDGQATVEKPNTEISELTKTIEEQAAKIADLQKQLEDAKKEETTPPITTN